MMADMSHPSQDGLLRPTSAFREEGLSTHAVTRLVKHGELTRVRRGFMTCPSIWTLSRRISGSHAPRPLVHPDGVLSHMSAAIVHGLPSRRSDLAHVRMTRPGPSHGRREQLSGYVMLRWTRSIASRCPDSPAPALSEPPPISRTMPCRWGVIVADAALRAGANPDLLSQQLARATHWKGYRQADRALSFADARAESPAESLSRVQMDRLGISAPQLQFPITREGHTEAIVDFAWPELGVVGEVDGRIKYGELLRPGQTTADVVMAEKRREERIRQAGWWICRWGWSEANDPRALGILLRRAFALAPGRVRQAG